MRKEVREGGRREADGSQRARTGVNRKWYRYIPVAPSQV